VSFFIALLIGTVLIPFLKALKLGHHVREEEPEKHQKKSGTPSFGGFIFILGAAFTMLIMKHHIRIEGIVALLGLIAFGFIGFLDDAVKVLRKENLGLKAYQKMILLLIVSALFSFYMYFNIEDGTSIIIPFFNKTIDLGKWYLPFMIFYFACTTNAANFADGLDGLAGTIGLLIMTFFATLSFGLGHYTLAIFCSAVIGGLLGFLKFNMFPAKIFMGDTGSLAIGGAVATVAMLLKMPLIILLVGGIYVIELLSVIIQIASFKLRGKRVFRMSPIHYHFELGGFDESKIVSIFSIITVIFCFIAFLSL
jgi:phospho-N-acetylmuramoyl-pentapeptide-transferase